MSIAKRTRRRFLKDGALLAGMAVGAERRWKPGDPSQKP